MLDYTLTIALAPLRRDVAPRTGIFNWEKAEQRSTRVIEHIRRVYSSEKVRFIDTEGLCPGNVLCNDVHADAAIERFSHAKADAVVLINCNFGSEEISARIGAELGKPVLLWAPQDDEFAPDGMRYTDSQCGLFGISKQLQRLNVPFSYIENCRIEDVTFDRGFKRFIRVTCMVKNFRGMSVAQVGMRPKPFRSVIYNEGELLQRFGLRMVPVNMAVVIDKYNRILQGRGEQLRQGAELLRARYEMDELTESMTERIYAFVLLYQEIFEEYKVDAISSECWSSMQLGVGAMPCTALSVLADMGYIIACEADLHGAVTMALLSCAAMGERVPFFGEFTTRHPENRNTELLWHCGPFAYSLKKETSLAKNINMRPWFEVKEGQYTVARFDQDDGRYSLLHGLCRSADGPYTFGTYLWAEFDNLSRWEHKIIHGPYIHHMAEIEGDYTQELAEFCRYIPQLASDGL